MSDELTRLPGIGAAAARALEAAGIATIEALAAIDPANPPALAGFRGKPDWPAWVAAAKSPPSEDEPEERAFTVISPLQRNGKLTGIGGAVKLSRAEFDLLKASGVIEGDW